MGSTLGLPSRLSPRPRSANRDLQQRVGNGQHSFNVGTVDISVSAEAEHSRLDEGGEDTLFTERSDEVCGRPEQTDFFDEHHVGNNGIRINGFRETHSKTQRKLLCQRVIVRDSFPLFEANPGCRGEHTRLTH